MVDRVITYAGSIPLDTDVLSSNKNTMIGVGALAQAILGTSTIVDGLTCTPTTPASMSVLIASGSMYQLSTVDSAAYGSLSADTTNNIVKQGISLSNTTLTLTAPSTSGFAQNYLIQAAYSEQDANAVVLPYYNASNPSQAYAGPNNSGVAQPTVRKGLVLLTTKAGVAATSGAQQTPAADAGYVGLYVVTVSNGQSTITSGNIAIAAGAPFIPYKLPNLRPGFSNIQTFTSSGTFTVPSGVTKVKVTVVGGGGGGGSTTTGPGSGGGAGATAIKICTVSPGQSIAVTIGSGTGFSAAGANGASGGTSSFGAFCSATGGVGGAGGAAAAAGGGGGTASGGDINLPGGYGTDGKSSTTTGGDGGVSFTGGAGRGTTGFNTGLSAPGYGSGGGGGGSSTVSSGAASGGQGAAGIVIVEY